MRRYLDLFVAESRDHLVGAYEVLGRLELDPDDSELWRELLRHAHSLKGMAAAMGFDSMVALAHAAEDLADPVSRGGPTRRPSLTLLGDALGCLGEIVDRVERGEDAESPRAFDLAGALRGAPTAAPTDAQPVMARASVPPDRPSVGSWRLTLDLDERATSSARASVRLLGALADLGTVVAGAPPSMDLASGRFAGRLCLSIESALTREELERRLAAIDGVRAFSLAPDLPRGDVAPARSSASPWLRVRADRVDAILERVLDLRRERARTGGAGNVDRAEILLDEIHADLMDMRLVPFGSVAHRIHQAVRELSSDLGKPVRFSIEGESVRLDRHVLDALVDPLLHAVRNGLDHGIEPPAERLASGKIAEGEMRLRLERRGDRVRILVEDDGRGLSPSLLRQAAVAAGRIDACSAAALDDASALMLATLPNVSTAAQVSHVSGRGVGLDVVRDVVKRLGGLLDIQSTPGAGTTVCLTVPFSIAQFGALVVRSGGCLFAIPMSAVERAVDGAESRDVAAGHAAVGLAERLGIPRHDAQGDPRWWITVRTGERVAGLGVDEIVGQEELVVEPMRRPLAALPFYAGTALLDDGAIALVLDPSRLL
jgi:two-component system chemotaxis sensor kinase CheA